MYLTQGFHRISKFLKILTSKQKSINLRLDFWWHEGCKQFWRDFLLLQYIDDTLPAESPYLYGLHPNAEIGFLTQTSEKLFRTVLEMQPRDGGGGEGGGTTRDEKVKTIQDRWIGSYQNTLWIFFLVN